jgi:hypothetical protein
MDQYLRDNKGFIKGRVVFDSPAKGDKTLYDKLGKFCGKYIYASNKTFDRLGRFFADGDQLLSLL